MLRFTDITSNFENLFLNFWLHIGDHLLENAVARMKLSQLQLVELSTPLLSQTIWVDKIRPHFTLRNILVHPKDKLKPIEGVYSIDGKNCKQEYIGETKRKLAVRVKEHKEEVEGSLRGGGKDH